MQLTAKELFDITDTDLPFKLTKQTQKEKLLELFEQAPEMELSIKQLRAGYYRLHNEILEANAISARLWSLINNSKVDRVKRGVFKLRGDV